MEKSEENLLKDAKRLLAVNAGEQKRLEKFHKYIDKKKREKERALTRAQREAILRFYECSGKGLQGILHAEKKEKVKGHKQLRAVASSDAVLQNPEAKPSGGNDKNKTRQNKKLSLQETTSKRLLPELDFSNFSTHTNKPLRRTRSWSSPTLVFRPEDHIRSNESRKEQRKGLLFDKQKGHSASVSCVEKNTFQDKCEEEKGDVESKKPLSAILPPLILPPLHALHRRPSLKEQNKSKDNDSSGDKSLKKQYEELSDCRYLRVYHPFIKN